MGKGKGLSFERPWGPDLVPKEILQYLGTLQLILESLGGSEGQQAFWKDLVINSVEFIEKEAVPVKL